MACNSSTATDKSYVDTAVSRAETDPAPLIYTNHEERYKEAVIPVPRGIYLLRYRRLHAFEVPTLERENFPKDPPLIYLLSKFL